MNDRVLGVIGVALAAFFIWQATQIQTSFISDPVGAKTFPIIIGASFGLASLVMVIRPDPAPHWPGLPRLFEIAVAIAVLVAYSIALPEAGFVISTAIGAAFLSWRLGSGPLAACIAGVVIAVGLYVVFHTILGLSLARGPFGF